jgi:hypothetical protein
MLPSMLASLATLKHGSAKMAEWILVSKMSVRELCVEACSGRWKTLSDASPLNAAAMGMETDIGLEYVEGTHTCPPPCCSLV